MRVVLNRLVGRVPPGSQHRRSD